MIATGRYNESIIGDIVKYKIKFDYLICNNGAEIYDSEYNLLKYKKLPLDSVNKAKKLGMRLLYTIDGENLVGAIHIGFDEEVLKEALKLKNVIVQYSKNKVKIIPDINKIDGINYVLRKYKNISVYAFGDDHNDYKMLEAFNGYTLNRHLEQDGVQLVKSISSVVRKL